jgi:hypothetical protein
MPLKKRWLYPLLFAIPIVLVSAIVASAVFGAAAGVMWLFVAGDDAWPAWTDPVLVGTFVLAFAATAIVLARIAYAAGVERESEASGNGAAVLTALGAGALLLLAIGAYQWRVGNLGPKSDGVLCSEFCMTKGYGGSGMPPRDSGDATCSCIDAQGREAVRMPMNRIRSLQ